jgi:hypothetical protein
MPQAAKAKTLKRRIANARQWRGDGVHQGDDGRSFSQSMVRTRFRSVPHWSALRKRASNSAALAARAEI